ncbi:hypothetical protein [Devosia sp.]|uniref:hypothetical protein n=1 Tax=Devosia sp. TaxID=1871048 RepID=UPI002FC730DB
MSTISINNETRPLEQADANWITRQINGRREDGVSVCVRVSIQSPNINVALATSGCQSGGGSGGGRAPNNGERDVLDLWERHKLNQSDFPAGQLVAFVGQVLRLL